MAAFRVFMIALALTAPVWARNAMPVAACSCGPTWISLVEAQIVAVGTVTDMRPAHGLPNGLPGPDYIGIEVLSEIAVEEYLRGAAGPSLLVHSETSVQIGPGDEFKVSPGPRPDCGYGLRLEARYLAFFTDANEEYWTSACSGNVREIRSDDTLADVRRLLQEPTPRPSVIDLPETGTGTADTHSTLGWPVAASAAGVLLAASASAIFFALRQRPS